MKRILILANNDIGLYKFRKELIMELLRENEVYISLPYGDYIPELKEMGCKFIDTTINRRGINPFQDLFLLFKYRKLIKEINPYTVLTYTIKPNIYGGLACRLLRVPYIANVTGLGTAVENPGVIQKITVNLYRIAFKNIKCIFFQNEENQRFFYERNIAFGKYKLLPGSGVNLNAYPLLDYPTDNVIKFVFISRIMKEKGIDNYLEAAEYIIKKYKNVEFHICGFCEENYEKLIDDYTDNKHIIYHGLVKDISKILRNMHCTIHPTYYPEGMSNVLLESSASGRPIITTNRSGCREIIDNGVTGFLVNQQDSKDLVDKIEMFLNLSHEEKRNMGIKGREKINKEFDREIVINAYLNEIAKLS